MDPTFMFQEVVYDSSEQRSLSAESEDAAADPLIICI
jgi:hypothetical protein